MKRNKQLAKHQDPNAGSSVYWRYKKEKSKTLRLACSRAGRAELLSVETRIVRSRSLVTQRPLDRRLKIIGNPSLWQQHVGIISLSGGEWATHSKLHMKNQTQADYYLSTTIIFLLNLLSSCAGIRIVI